jgi:hypothetical protein
LVASINSNESGSTKPSSAEIAASRSRLRLGPPPVTDPGPVHMLTERESGERGLTRREQQNNKFTITSRIRKC